MQKVMIILLAVTLSACGSGGSDSPGTCNLTNQSKATFTTVTKTAASDPSCPTISASQFNSSMSSSGDDAGDSVDAGPGPCAPQISPSGCSATYSCMVGAETLSGAFTASGSSFTGTITLSAGGSTGLNCGYTIGGTIQ